MSRIAIAALAAASLAGCAATGGSATADADGTLVIVAAYEEPPAGQPISIGGYGFFASIDDEPEIEIPFDGSLRLPLAAGSHELVLRTRPASDMIVVNENGEPEREFYEVSAECVETVDVPAGGVLEVTYRAAGGEACEVAIAGG
jgi:hypothetical protein